VGDGAPPRQPGGLRAHRRRRPAAGTRRLPDVARGAAKNCLQTATQGVWSDELTV
jgi:hypothetical protein